MLKQIQRVRLESDYRYILNRGKKSYAPFFLMSKASQRDTSLVSTRFGFITSKKVGKATIRNKLRRQFREIIRKEIDNIKPGFDVVIVVSPKAVNVKFPEIQKELLKQLRLNSLLV
jgi:ribonuclease P protein component